MAKTINYELTNTWSGANQGTTDLKFAYSREFTIQCQGKPNLVGSADPAFKGDPSVYNPEELLVSALSSCHLLSYLYVCAVKNIHVLSYVDHATGKMEVSPDGGRFSEVTLNPTIVISESSDLELAKELHEEAHKKCFIANSVNFAVKVNPSITKQ
ncbi:MAG: OsmC family protein [Gammaproteobacteria bacterium]